MAEEIAMTVMTAETKTSFALAGSTCSISSAEPLAPRTWKSVYSSSDLLPDGSSLCVFELGSLRRILPVFAFSTRQISVSERGLSAPDACAPGAWRCKCRLAGLYHLPGAPGRGVAGQTLGGNRCPGRAHSHHRCSPWWLHCPSHHHR